MFRDSTISSRAALNSGVRERQVDAAQDRGFPVGDSDFTVGQYKETGLAETEPAVASAITSTYTPETFFSINRDHFENLGIGTPEDDRFDANMDDPDYDNRRYYGRGGFDHISYSGNGACRNRVTVSPWNERVVVNGVVRYIADGSILIERKDGSEKTDRLHNVEGVWFGDCGEWYDIKGLLATETTISSGFTYNGSSAPDWFVGTAFADVFDGLAGNDVFTASAGDDRYLGGAGYDQINYDGAQSVRSNFSFILNHDDTVSVISDTFGSETYEEIEGVWFNQEGKWYSLDELVR